MKTKQEVLTTLFTKSGEISEKYTDEMYQARVEYMKAMVPVTSIPQFYENALKHSHYVDKRVDILTRISTELTTVVEEAQADFKECGTTFEEAYGNEPIYLFHLLVVTMEDAVRLKANEYPRVAAYETK